MKNLTILNLLTNKYHEHAFAKDYMLGFVYANVVYLTICDFNVCRQVISLDKASRGAGYAIRFKPNRDKKVYLLTQNTKPICSVEYFKGLVANSKYNRGEIFEKLVTEMFGQKWEKDNVPFTIAGDIEVDGIPYQIKFENATFSNEKSLARL